MAEKKLRADRKIYHDYIYKIISGFENHLGKPAITGYVPRRKNGTVIGRSGVTIATGIDLGQMNEWEIKNLKLPCSLEKKLLPYALKKKSKAVEFLKEHPLKITDGEAKILEHKYMNASERNLQKKYNAASKVPFASLPKEMQAVISSVNFQFCGKGAGLDKALPVFWGYVTSQEWAKAIDWLKKQKQYKGRRTGEAKLLEEGTKPATPAKKDHPPENKTKQKQLVIGRMDDISEDKLKSDEFTLPGSGRLPDKGSPKANWKQNSSELRKEIRKNQPIRDASASDSTPAPTPLNPNRTIKQTFTGAERNLLRNNGWEKRGDMWYPPNK